MGEDQRAKRGAKDTEADQQALPTMPTAAHNHAGPTDIVSDQRQRYNAQAAAVCCP